MQRKLLPVVPHFANPILSDIESCRRQLWPEVACFQVVCPSHTCEHVVSGTPWGNFSKFSTNICLDCYKILKVQGHCDLTRHIFGVNLRIHTYYEAKSHMSHTLNKFLFSKGQKSTSLWYHNVKNIFLILVCPSLSESSPEAELPLPWDSLCGHRPLAVQASAVFRCASPRAMMCVCVCVYFYLWMLGLGNMNANQPNWG